VVATFFVNALNFADMRLPTSHDSLNLKKAFDIGHQIGTLTFSHKDMARLNTQQMWDEMRLNDDAIKAIIGKRPIHMRPPLLSTSNAMLTAMD
jgi:peptidoglycan/xylan/chitin deacetylase (PgdA/CDA1 family)